LRVVVDPKAPQPPSEQIADQVRFAVAAGRLAPGDQLPSVRGLAATALVNPNTVAKAYRELEREGTVETRPGAGCYVAAGAPRRCAALRGRTIAARLGRAVDEAVAAGLAPVEVKRLVAAALARAAVDSVEVTR